MLRVAKLRVVKLRGWHILKQLWLEEALLRHTKDNWILTNHGPHAPVVVMGLSGEKDELCHMQRVQRDGVLVLRRFTGGGTVVVDAGTAFVSLVFNCHDADEVKPYPRDIMHWTAREYTAVFGALSSSVCKRIQFEYRENDYAIGEKKIGGNAQAITKNRWIHHTSFLIDFQAKNMEYLQIPKKRPEYRQARDHTDFLIPLRSFGITQNALFDATIAQLSTRFQMEVVDENELQGILSCVGGMEKWSAEARTQVVVQGTI